MNPETNPGKKSAALIIAGMTIIAIPAFFIGRGCEPTTVAEKTASTEEHEGHAHDEHGHEEGEHAEEEGHSEGEEHGDEHGHGEEEIKFDAAAAKTAGITLTTVNAGLAAGGVPFTGEIAPDPNGVVRVSSLVPGRVVSLFVVPGDRVRQGQTLAVVESRAIGEAQSSYRQAESRYTTARGAYDVVVRQAKAGVFSRAPIEAARREMVNAAAEVRTQSTAVRAARTVQDTALRLARAGSFQAPAIEAAINSRDDAALSLKTSQAAEDEAQASIAAAEKELDRRRQMAAAGSYNSRPVEEARRALASARGARSRAATELNLARASANRAKSLSGDGLIARRELEAAQSAVETAEATLQSAQAEENTAEQELERQQKLAATDVSGNAEVQSAQSALVSAQTGLRARRAEVARAKDGLRLAEGALQRERKIAGAGIANRREVVSARATLETAQSALVRARQNLSLATTAYAREEKIFKGDLNNLSQVQAARGSFVQAQSDLRAARTALNLLKSSPGGSAQVPITSPISGVVQERDVTRGEVLSGESHLMTIADFSRVHIDIFLAEQEIAKVRVGSPMRAVIDAVPGRVFNGHIELIHTELDPKTRTVEAHAEIPNPDGVLRFGMSTRGTITTGSPVAAITVPAESVQKMDDKTVVFVALDEPNTFVAREVKTGATQSGRTVITSGLKNGERVVVKGAFMVKAQAMKAELGHKH